jgi:hypothetical protein
MIARSKIGFWDDTHPAAGTSSLELPWLGGKVVELGRQQKESSQ